ncbi:hypothetical protein QQ008_29960 [Fulvivirgaceae bacterium BMA10]|uniref:Uncharacterized protein n=1 Tax=Splendidivirga corallicola TaxID=3051826 RepID=A0ABT8KXZ6_9BACT|nr:hypothetical protein [Fulvivirgaceae bacterium BMA10]
MAVVTIYIKAQDTTSGMVLELSDSQGHHGINDITTDIDPGDTVIWQRTSNSHIDDLSDIFAKEGSQCLFVNGGPAKNMDGTWSGVVKQNVTGDEDYNIQYKVNGTTYLCDPKLRINK